jgi:hypothetical protein
LLPKEPNRPHPHHDDDDLKTTDVHIQSRNDDDKTYHGLVTRRCCCLRRMLEGFVLSDHGVRKSVSFRGWLRERVMTLLPVETRRVKSWRHPSWLWLSKCTSNSIRFNMIRGTPVGLPRLPLFCVCLWVWVCVCDPAGFCGPLCWAELPDVFCTDRPTVVAPVEAIP